MLDDADEVYVARGRSKVVHVPLADARPDDEELLGMLLGRSGKLRAPTLRKGRTVLVGFNADMLADQLT